VHKKQQEKHQLILPIQQHGFTSTFSSSSPS
jgi:hypothetical protein